MSILEHLTIQSSASSPSGHEKIFTNNRMKKVLGNEITVTNRMKTTCQKAINDLCWIDDGNGDGGFLLLTTEKRKLPLPAALTHSLVCGAVFAVKVYFGDRKRDLFWQCIEVKNAVDD